MRRMSDLFRCRGALHGLPAERAVAGSARREAQVRKQTGARKRSWPPLLEGVHLVGTDARIFDCNESFARIVGYTREELVGMPIGHYRSPPACGASSTPIGRIVEQGAERFFAQHTHRDGHAIDVEVSARTLSA